MTSALVLLSGGLDSTTVLAYALKKGYDVATLSFDYGQRHNIELLSSRSVADFYGVENTVFKIDLRQVGGSSLTSEMPVEKRDIEKIGESVPNTYVPGRNTIFLSVAAAIAEVRGGIDRIMIGANAIDYSGYPDCRPAYFSAMERALSLGTRIGNEKGGFHIEVPLQYLSKAEIIRLGSSLGGAPYHLTTSCYEGKRPACGRCDSCQLRLRGFMEAGLRDPLEYESFPEFYSEYLKKGRP